MTLGNTDKENSPDKYVYDDIFRNHKKGSVPILYYQVSHAPNFSKINPTDGCFRSNKWCNNSHGRWIGEKT